MAGKIDARLKEHKIELPQAAAPLFSYVPYVIAGKLLFVSGQVTVWNGEFKFIGKVGREFTVEQGQEAARMCALNVVAQAKAACGGDLDKIKRCVKVTGFVNCPPDFHDHPKVINGASELFAQVFGDAGKHARAAVGSVSLPLGVATEVEAVFELV